MKEIKFINAHGVEPFPARADFIKRCQAATEHYRRAVAAGIARNIAPVGAARRRVFGRVLQHLRPPRMAPARRNKEAGAVLLGQISHTRGRGR